MKKATDGEVKSVDPQALETPTVPQVPEKAMSQDELKELAIQMAQLLKIQAQREIRLNQKEAEDNQRIEAKKHQREQASKSSIRDILEAQKHCTHMKGGKNHTNEQNVNYNVSYHVFIDGTRRIKCLSGCGMKWFKEDTRDFLVRKGNKIPNHTGIGWNDALYMTKHSSNTRSTSEMPPSVLNNLEATPEERAAMQAKDEPKFEYEL